MDTTVGTGRPTVRLRSGVVRDRLAMRHRSVKWLAGELGISRAYLSRLLALGRAPSGRVRLRMQEVLGAEEFDELFSLERSG